MVANAKKTDYECPICSGRGRVPGRLPGRAGVATAKIVERFPSLAPRFVQPGLRAGQFLFAFCPDLHCHRLPGEPLLLGGARVARNFGHRAMPSDRAYLIGAAFCVCQPGCRRLSQSVRATVG